MFWVYGIRPVDPLALPPPRVEGPPSVPRPSDVTAPPVIVRGRRERPERELPTPVVPETPGTARAPAAVRFDFFRLLQGVVAVMTGGPQGVLVGVQQVRAAVTVIPGVGAVAAPVRIPDPIEREFEAAVAAAERAAAAGREVAVRRLEFSPGFVAVGPEGTQRVMVQTVTGPRTVEVAPSGAGARVVAPERIERGLELAGPITRTTTRDVTGEIPTGAVGPGSGQIGGVTRAEQIESRLSGPATIEQPTEPTPIEPTPMEEPPLRRIGGVI